MPRKLDLMMDRLVGAVETVLALILIAAVLLNCLNIAGRYFFHYSITGSDEIEIFGMIAISFVGLMVVSWRDRHLRMDVLARSAPPWLQRVLAGIERLLILAVALLLLVVSFEYVDRMYQLNIISETTGIPMWIPHISVTLGFVLTVLVIVVQIIARCRAVFGAGGKAGDA